MPGPAGRRKAAALVAATALTGASLLLPPPPPASADAPVAVAGVPPVAGTVPPVAGAVPPVAGAVSLVAADVPVATAGAPVAVAGVPLVDLGRDPYQVAGAQAGADTYQWGATVVAVRQAGRFFDGGSAGLAVSVSGDGGVTWESVALPGITRAGGGPYQRVSDPSVAYDARHGVWLITSLALTDPEPGIRGVTGTAVLVSRSTDGGRTWGLPLRLAAAGTPDRDATRPDADDSDTGDSDTGDSDAGDSDAGDSDAGDSAAGGPDATRPGAGGSDGRSSDATRPTAGGPGGDRDLDKPWIACDNTPASPHHGRCHVAFGDHAAGDTILMARSADGGLTWAATGTPAAGTGAQPVVRPDGSVVVPYLGGDGSIRAFRSRDGGATWGGDTLVSGVQRHTVGGGMRALPLPSAEADATGTVYVAWHDCRFQLACAGNDIVLAASRDGGRWGPVLRVTSGAGDHFIPGLGVDRSSSGGTARLALAYYRYPDAACAASACRLTVAYTSSVNGGRTWSPPVELHGPMDPAWLAGSAQGRMAGDYLSTSIVPGGNALPVFVAGGAPSGGVSGVRAYTVAGGLPVTGGGPAPLSVEIPIAAGEPFSGLPLTAR
ncbi:sialidase family protein [Nonomuraea sp. NPDC050783]|uniref:sialidase family protein n=1 Tax=Nonomuraea sp. NPDC050783 TaxID=3154634 RepID=UPI0034654243